MELSRHSPAPARYMGIGLVIAVHAVAITALSMAFIVKPTAKPPGPIKVVDVRETPKPPPPDEPKRKVDAPVIVNVPVPPIPIPNEPTITPEPTVFDLTAKATPPTDRPIPTGPAVTQPPTVVKPQVLTPGAVCSAMPRPEVPVLNWAGEAVLHVVATVRGGRVVGTEFSMLQGALDAKSKRALQRSVESALGGYQCQGDASFQQDFAFRLE